MKISEIACKEVEEEDVAAADEESQSVLPNNLSFTQMKPKRLTCVPCISTSGWLGRSFCLWGSSSKDSHIFPFICIVGPDVHCWAFTVFLCAVPWVLTYIFSASKNSVVSKVLCISFGAIHILSFLLASCSDPGIIRRSSNSNVDPTNSGTRKCTYCAVQRPPRAHHCFSCNVCVLELDHHCPWTGKCIGKYNLRFFYAFLCCNVVAIFAVIVLNTGASNL